MPFVKIFAIKVLAKIFPFHVISILLLPAERYQGMEPINDGTFKMISSIEYIFMMQNAQNKSLSGMIICIFETSLSLQLFHCFESVFFSPYVNMCSFLFRLSGTMSNSNRRTYVVIQRSVQLS